MSAEYIDIEKNIHGKDWDKFHDGYFSNVAIAKPFIRIINKVITTSQPDVIADLGGGTGFLLSQLHFRDIPQQIKLLNLDCSDAQLEIADKASVSTVHQCITDFQREDIFNEGNRILLMMRSVLHYFGEQKLPSVLRHLRSQTQKGEYFVHQTAVFDSKKEAGCANMLYQEMRTKKWYPTHNELQKILMETGWQIKEISSAPPLLLTSEDLGRRYALNHDEMMEIRNKLLNEFGEMEDIFHLVPDGFHAYLHYKIFTCLAIE